MKSGILIKSALDFVESHTRVHITNSFIACNRSLNKAALSISYQIITGCSKIYRIFLLYKLKIYQKQLIVSIVSILFIFLIYINCKFVI